MRLIKEFVTAVNQVGSIFLTHRKIFWTEGKGIAGILPQIKELIKKFIFLELLKTINTLALNLLK